MKILVIGSDGFIGRNVVAEFSKNHEVFTSSRKTKNQQNHVVIDLAASKTILEALQKVQPDIIVQCAGIVENTEAAANNPIFTKNLLEQVVASNLKPTRVIICGSAAEYGEVSSEDLPAKETAPLSPNSPYRKSKVEETNIALSYRKVHELPIVVARIFNPIGPGMQEKFLTSRVLAQIKDFKLGRRDNIEVNRLDSLRDYIDIHDLVAGIRAIAENNPSYDIYNIGSGKATSNGELIDLMLSLSNLDKKPKVVEVATEPEPVLACQADIDRMKLDFGWEPSVKLEDTVKEIVDATE